MIKAIIVIVGLISMSLVGCAKQAVVGKGIVDPTYEKVITQHRGERHMVKKHDIEGSVAGTLEVTKDLEQLIIVEAHDRDEIYATVSMHEKQEGIWKEILRVDGYLGYGGIDKQKEGDGKTPTGVYGLSVPFGKASDPGSLMPYTQIDEKYWWVGDYKSKYFNQLCHEDMEGRDWKLDPSVSERLWDYKGYNYCLFVEYNVEGVNKKGSCIFLHCIGENLETLGCIAVEEENMIFILQHLKEGAKILIDTAENLTSY